MSALLVVGLVLGTTLYGVPPDLDVDEAMAKYQSSCSGSSTPECKQLQWQLEGALYGALRAYQNYYGKGVDPEVVMVALQADSPQLKAWGIRAVRNKVPPGAVPLLVEALDDPYPAVREAALNALQSVDPKYGRYSERVVRRDSGRGYPRADPVPTAAILGGEVYPGATYRAFASSDKLALYTTPDSVDKVLGFYAKGGRKAQTAEEVKAAAQKKAQEMSDPQAMMALMRKAQAEGKDITAMMIERQKSLAGGSELMNFQGRQGVVAPKYVPLKDDGSKRVLVFKDEVLGATSVVFEVSDPERDALTTQAMTGKGGLDPMKRSEIQTFLRKPLADGSTIEGR